MTLSLCLPLALALTTQHEPEDCPASVYTGEFMCLTVPVYENRTERKGHEIELHVVILPALGDDPAPDPVFLLMGGPGQSAGDKAAYFADVMRTVRQDRDLVLVDSRGTGDSNPLDFELSTADLVSEVDETLPPERVKRELLRLRELADLKQYTTGVMMDDLDEVREVLGYEKINLYGASYGTRAALVYLRRHEENVRTVVIKAVAPPGFSVGTFFARDAQLSLDALFEACAADPKCAQAYGDLPAKFERLLADLDREPQMVETKSPLDGTTVQVRVTGRGIALAVRNMLYSAGGRSLLPGLIARGVEGQLEEWASQMLTNRVRMIDQLYEGMALSVLAAEDLPIMSDDVIENSAADTFLGAKMANDMRAAASLWPQAQLDPSFWEPVQSDVPVLLISGSLDPVTPPRFAEDASRYLSNSLHLVFQHGSHDDAPFRPCMDNVLEAFFRTGTVEGLDTGCVESAQPVPFAVR